MISSQQLEGRVRTAIQIWKRRRRDQAAFFVAALCFSGGFALTKEFGLDFKTDKWLAGLQIALYAIGAIALVYGVVRVWRLVNPPELPPAKDRPSAIKGPMAFTEADGDLFRKLGREKELQKLLGLVLDDQVLMVVVRGASGAGKTSLLRAGLKHILRDGAVFHYWEAVPAEPDKGLLRAVHEKWPEGAAKPATLAELVNSSDALGRQAHVIVLDQFEQLRGSRKIFQLLRRIIRESKPPHRITWVIAFRREFSADWMDFISPEQENGVRPPQDVPLRLFTAEQAREIIGQLIDESDLKDSIEQSVINNLVEAATVDGEVSPVDIGIGLLVLTELHERQSGQTITNRDYQFAGGAEGLLTQYISRCLEPYPKENQEAILKAMLALRDPEENRQRLAIGLTIDELAVEAGTDARVLKLQLNRLADRDIRLLEADTPTDGSAVRYRLPHERLIPALYRLTGKLLAEVDQAKLKFQNAFQAWQNNNKRSRYLLKGKELRLVQRYQTQIPWGRDEQEKKSFLFQSKRRRQIVQAAMVVAVLVLIGIGWFSILQYQRFENRRYLTESGYPAELYNFQYQLKKLELTEPLNLEYFTWLSSDSIEELSLKAGSSSNSIAGLTSLSRCRSLKKLTLDLSDAQVRDLRPLAQLKGLTQLSLDLSRSELSDLRPLAQLKGLTQLNLNLPPGFVRDVTPLAELQGLTQLTLHRGLLQPDLASLAQLKGLTQLTIDAPQRSRIDFIRLQQLKSLRQLTLDLTDVRGRVGTRPPSDWESLEQLEGLTHLKLYLDDTQASDLKALARLKRLTELTLHISGSQLRDLKALEQLHGLTQLTLDLVASELHDLKPLEQLQELEQLSLRISDSQSDLKPLRALPKLTQFTLDLTGSPSQDPKPLEQLQGLPQLTLNLNVGAMTDLTPLEQLQRVQQLTLQFRGSQSRDLKPLERLHGLQQLLLNLSDSQLGDLKPLETLGGLTQLTLYLSTSRVHDLRSLKELKGLLQLTLDLQYSPASDFESVRQMTGLRTLSIVTATRAQRMSLRQIPASLVELSF
jgi:hypothetical protein